MLTLLPTFALLVAMQMPSDTLSDEAIVAYASRPFDKGTAVGTTLGIHHGTRVVVEFRCSDICPAYTTRIIHYVVTPGPDCNKIGGVARSQMVPVAIAMMPQTFCVPKILAVRNLY